MGNFKSPKRKKIAIVTASILGLLGIFLLGFAGVYLFKPKQGSLVIESNKVAKVFVNGSAQGQTPLTTDKFKGEVDLKLVVEGGQEYRGKVNVVSGITTVVRRTFADNPDLSGGMIISFEKSQGETALVVVSNPDSVEVTIDGVFWGFAPYKSSNIAQGNHDVVVSATGYKETKITVNVVNGYKLTILIDLERDGSILATPTPTPTPFLPVSKTVLVEIKDTPTGFLRVRADPSADGEEIGRVKPKDRFPLVEESGDGKWYKVEWEDGKTGWISVEFATRIGFVQEPSKPVISPTP